MADYFSNYEQALTWIYKLDQVVAEGSLMVAGMFARRYGAAPYVGSQIGKLAEVRTEIRKLISGGWDDLPGPNGDRA